MLGVKTANKGANMGNKSYQVLKSMGNKSAGSMNKSAMSNNSIPIRENESNSSSVMYMPLGLKKEPGMKRLNTIEKR